jgi:glycosyltransferase involved in cell wall biosynthesis
MRVLVVDHVGGIEVFREKYEILASEHGVDLDVFVPETWIENGRVVRAGGGASGYRLRTGRAAFRGYENRGFFYTGLSSAMRRVRPDILHLVEEPYGLMALQSVVLARLHCPGAKILFYTFDNLYREFRYPYRPSWFYGRVQRLVDARADCATAACGEAGAVLRARGFTRPIRYVPLGVNPDRYRREGASSRRAEFGLGDFVVGFVGRLIPAKGVSLLLDALLRLRGSWSCLIIGDGPEGPRVEELARSRGLADRVRVVRGVPHAEVPAFLNLMDVMVLPSRTTPKWKEQFGRALVEAMACEVAVVGSDSGAIPEVIGDAGIVFPEGDATALASALEDLRADPARREALAASGRERVLRFFTWRRVADMYTRLYDGLMQGSLPSEEVPEWSTSFSS